MSGLGIALATRGVICCKQGAAVVTGLVPDTQLSLLEPEVFAGSKGAPVLKVTAPDLTPCDTDIVDGLAPQLSVTHTASPVPDARPKETTKEPSVKIRPLEDLSPTIVKKD